MQPFCLLLDESIDKMDRAQLTMYVCYFDLFTYNPKEEHVSIRKIGTAEMSKTIIWGPKPYLVSQFACNTRVIVDASSSVPVSHDKLL